VTCDGQLEPVPDAPPRMLRDLAADLFRCNRCGYEVYFTPAARREQCRRQITGFRVEMGDGVVVECAREEDYQDLQAALAMRRRP
jgi:hypothetical protein